MIGTRRNQVPRDQGQIPNVRTPGSCDADGHCITCSDEALDARVLCVDAASGFAVVAVQDQIMEVDISLIDDVQPEHVLLVHGGVALARVDEP